MYKLQLKQVLGLFLYTYGAESDKSVLPRVDVLVIRPVSPHVRCAVHQPGGVQHQGVPQQSRDEVRHPQGLAPEVPRHEHRDKEAHQQHRELVVPGGETNRKQKTAN